MKKILFAAVIISISFAACKKDNETQPEKVKIDNKVQDGDDQGDKKDDIGDGWE